MNDLRVDGMGERSIDNTVLLKSQAVSPDQMIMEGIHGN
jgi:hypothetical protein